MHNRIFRKYYTVFAVLVTITVLCLGVISGVIIGFDSYNERNEAMERSANKIASTVAAMPKNYHIIAGSFFDNSISAVKETLEGDVVVFGENGMVNICTMPPEKQQFSERIVEFVLSGNNYRSTRYFSKASNVRGYTIGVPVMTGDGHIEGAVFVTTYENNINSVVVGTLLIFMFCGISVLMVAFIVLFFITKRLTKPMYEMSEIAHSYAQGDFSKRLDVSRSHEFAQVASAFNSMADGVDSLERMRRGFVADVSHELRTPLTTITGFVDGMLDGTIPPELYDKYLAIVSEEAHRVSRMVSGFLDVAKMQSGQMTYVKAPFDIVKTVGKTIFAFEEKILQKNITLTDDFEKDSITVVADEDAIYRVVYNLLDNAVKFTDENGQIRCSIETKDDKAVISVYNTGCGIPKEEAAHIFERFYKSDKSRGINKQGTGIGLYLVNNILKEHGENIILSSKEGKFANFRFTLPLYKD